MDVAGERINAIGPSRDGATDAASGELGPEEVWQEPVDRLLTRLATTEAGLASTEARSRLAIYGPNDAATVKRSPLWLQFLVRFRNPLVIILLVASALSAANGDIASFVIIIFIVTISITMDFVQETRAQNAVEALRRSVAVQATVRRDGAKPSLHFDQLVPGDIVELIAGDLVPADLASARKPRPVCQPGSPDGRALSSREERQRRGVGRGKSCWRIQCRVCRHVGDQRHRDHSHLSNRKQNSARASRDQPGREATRHRIRHRHSSLRHADHAVHRVHGAVCSGREYLLQPTAAGIV